MNIAASAYKSLLREYDEKQLRDLSEYRSRKERIEKEIPRLKEIEDETASLYVKSASAKLKGNPFDCAEALNALKKEKEELLKAKGYTTEDLCVHYECPLCKDTGYTDEGPCLCLKEKITDILYNQSNIRDVLKTENFEHFSLEYYSEEPISEGSSVSPRILAERALATAKGFVANFKDSDENLLISGGCGVGKTFLSNCIAKEIIESGYFVIYLSAIKLFDILSDAAFEREEYSNDIAGNIYDCDLLIIDDLGTEFSNSFRSGQLFDCINERLMNRKHTIISTNLSAKQLKDNYSERIFSRISNMYTMVKLLGSDIRIKKRLEN